MPFVKGICGVAAALPGDFIFCGAAAGETSAVRYETASSACCHDMHVECIAGASDGIVPSLWSARDQNHMCFIFCITRPTNSKWK